MLRPRHNRAMRIALLQGACHHPTTASAAGGPARRRRRAPQEPPLLRAPKSLRAPPSWAHFSVAFSQAGDLGFPIFTKPTTMDKKWQNLPGQFMDRSTGRCGRCGGRARPVWGGCSWCWRLVGRASGAYSPACVLRHPLPLRAAALRAPLVAAGSAAATVGTAWSRVAAHLRAPS